MQKALPIARGISLVRNASFISAHKKYGGRMLDIHEIEEFARRHPWRFRRIMRKQSIQSGTICVFSTSPLGSFISGGRILIQSVIHNEAHRLVVPKVSVLGIGLEAPNPLLLIHRGYSIRREGSVFTIMYDASFGGRLELLQKPQKIGWHCKIGGMPAGEPSCRSDRNALFYFERGAGDDSLMKYSPVELGRANPVRRGAGLCDGGRRSVAVDSCFGTSGIAVLVHDEKATALAVLRAAIAGALQRMKRAFA